MLMKIAGGAVMVMAGGKIGYDTADRYTRRIKELQAFQSGLWGLSSDIGFCMTTMDIALQKISKLLPTNVSNIFLDAGQMVTEGDTVNQAWEKAVNQNKKDLCLNDEDIDLIFDFGSRLGTNDAEGEINNINNTIEKLKLREKDAVYAERKYGKLCKTMGVCLGAFLTLIFI